MRRAGFVLVLALAGCASFDPYGASPIAAKLDRDDPVGYCARLFADVDRRIDHLGVRDAEAPRIAGFPYLRVDRASAALAPPDHDLAARHAWWLRLARLDDEARAAELANAALPDDDLARCRVLLADADKDAFDALRAAAVVPDRYSTMQRLVGLYPLTRLPFAAGVARWHDSVRAVYATPLAELDVDGRLHRYALADGATARRVRLPVSKDALGVPELSPFDRRALLAQHAPVLEIDIVADHDLPGQLRLDDVGLPTVEISSPTAYARVTHTLFAGVPHLQLVYTFWFAERPSRGAFDLLAGRLDGLVWRVTLDTDGTPLVYDTMHACGCYHLFFPTEHVAARTRPDSLDESLFAPQVVRAPQAGEAVVVRVQTGTHYVQRVTVESKPTAERAYRLDDERRTAALPRPGGGTRSAYGPDGLMAGSERTERLVFWPMGVISAGQMRQWGHHATAFIGRRHFDDPHLFDGYFQKRR